MDAAGLGACLEAIDPEKRTPEAIDRRLARQAVVTGRLTPWQARQLQLGRWKAMKIGKYVLLDAIGQGGMGLVYLAQDTRLGRQVAMKVLSRQRSQDPRALARFDREAKIAGRLQDEHLIRVYDEGEAFGFRYLVMEYINGRSAAQLVDEHGPLPAMVVAELIRQVALGLGSLHGQGLLHRDVTPPNILVSRGGIAKLTDLGLAVDPSNSSMLTLDGATLGTFDYLSPEQARNSRGIDPRSDLYSLGCSAYHLLSGRVPFPAPTLPEKLIAHRISEVQPLTDLVPSCPPGLDSVVRRMMRKSPGERYARASDVVSALEPFASGQVPLGRIVAMGADAQARSQATTVAGGAYPAEWFESESEVDIDGDAAGRSSGRDSQDVFLRMDLEPEFPAPADDLLDLPPIVKKWRPASWLIAVVALTLLVTVLALTLAILLR